MAPAPALAPPVPVARYNSKSRFLQNLLVALSAATSADAEGTAAAGLSLLRVLVLSAARAQAAWFSFLRL